MDAGVFLVESLNQNGWLDEPLEALAAGHGCGPEVMAQALEVVQSLEPAGVGAGIWPSASSSSSCAARR